ncbi:hypothetical protein B0H13DRAFT_2374241 [Mycena leptocephala]|nr:hypothetical protein B0H13DRAFT_2374241 [Mycena leptocephala]
MISFPPSPAHPAQLPHTLLLPRGAALSPSLLIPQLLFHPRSSLLMASLNHHHGAITWLNRRATPLLTYTMPSSPAPSKPPPTRSPGSSIDNPFSVDEFTGPVPPRRKPLAENAVRSSRNPLLVDDDGRVVDENGHLVHNMFSTPPPRPSSRFIQIFSSPPSIIPRTMPPRKSSSAAQKAREAAAARTWVRLLAALQAPASVSSARTRIRRRVVGSGSRADRSRPLSENELYLTDVRPPVATTDRPHHECSICKHIKSHPVIYGCGHGHCYICCRIALEYSWRCSLCNAPITSPPAPNYDEKTAIAFDIPGWVDNSVVSYSWAGLTFPT